MIKPIIRRFAEPIGFAIVHRPDFGVAVVQTPPINLTAADVDYSGRHTAEPLIKNVGPLCRCSINAGTGIASSHSYLNDRIYLVQVKARKPFQPLHRDRLSGGVSQWNSNSLSGR